MDDLRREFTILENQPDLVYFDNAATTLKPKSVVHAVVDYYETMSANIHRGDYPNAVRASNLYDSVRDAVAAFIGCKKDCVVFTTGTSEGLNLIAHGYGLNALNPGDVIVLSEVEHASNVLPWFHVAREKGCLIEYVPLKDDLSFDLSGLDELVRTKNVKIVSLAHISNVVGAVNDIKEIARIAHQNGAILVVDGAQAAGHIPLDVVDMDADFYVFSSHKMMGPTGVGILYGKPDLLEKTEPLMYGGDSNARYYKDGEYSLKGIPHRFETGTPNIEGVLGFGAAIAFVRSLDLNVLNQHVQKLQRYIMAKLEAMDHVTVYNSISDTGIIMFNVKGIFPQDVAAYLGHHNICVRAGTHCSKLTCGIFDGDSSVRASLYFYNTQKEAEMFINAMQSITLESVVALYV